MTKTVLLVLSMAVITYLIRMIPLVFLRKKITSTFICSFLYYVPFAVLSAMTFPFIFYSTGNFYTALCGTAVAIIATLTKRSLIIVASLACVAVLIASLII